MRQRTYEHADYQLAQVALNKHQAGHSQANRPSVQRERHRTKRKVETTLNIVHVEIFFDMQHRGPTGQSMKVPIAPIEHSKRDAILDLNQTTQRCLGGGGAGRQ